MGDQQQVGTCELQLADRHEHCTKPPTSGGPLWLRLCIWRSLHPANGQGYCFTSHHYSTQSPPSESHPPPCPCDSTSCQSCLSCNGIQKEHWIRWLWRLQLTRIWRLRRLWRCWGRLRRLWGCWSRSRRLWRYCIRFRRLWRYWSRLPWLWRIRWLWKYGRIWWLWRYGRLWRLWRRFWRISTLSL